MRLEEYFESNLGERVSDLGVVVQETVDDGLVDVIGERDDTGVLIRLGSDDALRDTGAALTILRQSSAENLVQYVTASPHSLVPENLYGFCADNRFECYAGNEECGMMRFSQYGGVPEEAEPAEMDSVASYLIEQYTSDERQQRLLKTLFREVYE